MNAKEQAKAAKEFAEYWEGKGYEKGESQKFWIMLLRKVYGVEEPETFISFEEQVKLDHTSFIDGFIHETHVMIEQKGIEKDLRKPLKQSDGTMLTPFQQAKRYAADIPYSERPRWIIISNFQSFMIYDMETPQAEPQEVLLKNLPKEYGRMQFLVNVASRNIKKEMELSIKAGEIVGKLYDALIKQYHHPDDEKTLKSLNVLCVRLVFCLYAEDSGLFGSNNAFHDYLVNFEPKHARNALMELFKVLNTKLEERDEYLDEEVAAFPYVNGGLFGDEEIEIPQFNQEIMDLLLNDASEGFDWSGISPTIFGAVFESTLNPDTRRKGGMHYTSISNIHKVIDPLFLDGLKSEYENIVSSKSLTKPKMKTALKQLQNRMAALNFFDPACGSGNFLTETYISLRRLENKIISLTEGDKEGSLIFGAFMNPIKVSISQFYGIEINDFAVTVAKTALWIAEAQMMEETASIIQHDLDFLPLKTNANIHEGNALTLDWNSVLPSANNIKIFGNPPFVGKKEQTSKQKQELENVFPKNVKGVGNMDYVSGWYIKAAQYMHGTKIQAAFVSTNSITQGEQVAPLWGTVFNLGMKIDFAHQTFKWTSESTKQAAVHCVIIGFSSNSVATTKTLFVGGSKQNVTHISPYLREMDNTFVYARTKPLCDVPEIVTGSQGTDKNNFQLEDDAYEEIIKKEPDAKPYIKVFYNSERFLKNKPIHCLWLKGIEPSLLNKMPLVKKRVELVREFRLQSTKELTRKQADIPTLWTEDRQPCGSYIVVPKVSSKERKYIPMDFLSPDIVCNNTIKFIPNAELYHFGILSSNVHCSWMRLVGGRTKSDYQYSNKIVYNTFPWPRVSNKDKEKIEKTAKMILDARKLYPKSSLSDLYKTASLPPELLRAHQANDKAVMQAYGFWGKLNSESECVAELMRMYEKLTNKEK